MCALLACLTPCCFCANGLQVKDAFGLQLQASANTWWTMDLDAAYQGPNLNQVSGALQLVRAVSTAHVHVFLTFELLRAAVGACVSSWARMDCALRSISRLIYTRRDRL